ncbi:MAG: AAA family ATPase [Pirellulales bacterium]|nr:AAA family ATPase [Pirellulales bacterium]
MRRLETKWKSNRGWPKRIEWLEISGLRGWTGQPIRLDFPLVAISGENGAGKSTILQAIAAIYRTQEETTRNLYATQFFPDSPWDKIKDALIKYQIREGDGARTGTLRKRVDRWRELPPRRERHVLYLDLKRIQALTSRPGYRRIAKAPNTEVRRQKMPEEIVNRLSTICGRTYDGAALALSNVDDDRWVPVASFRGLEYSGFHHGAGELALMEVLNRPMPKHCMVLIDEFETSLHPRAQRRFLREMAELCRRAELQIILTTHSPYVLDELPPEGRMYVMNQGNTKTIVTGVSPSFALTQMDDEPHPELDIYVEDVAAKILLEEVIVAAKRDLVRRCVIVPFGAANVGYALGQMVHEGRFPRPTLVYLDADQASGNGCSLLPGDDAPERVVFNGLRVLRWDGVAARISRAPGETIDTLDCAMTKADHHDWVVDAADRLVVGREELWRALCSVWVTRCAERNDLELVTQLIEDRIEHRSGATYPSMSIVAGLATESEPSEALKTECQVATPPGGSITQQDDTNDVAPSTKRHKNLFGEYDE